MDGLVGGMTVAARESNMTVENVGSGPAINVRYQFTPINPPERANVARPSGYLPSLPVRRRFAMPVARELLRNLHYEFVCTYQSLSGHQYETRIALENFVLTEVRFQRTGPPSHVGKSFVFGWLRL